MADRMKCTAVTAVAKKSGNHNQNLWLENPDIFEMVPVSKFREKSCGTSACLAGFTVLLFAPEGTKTDGNHLYFPDGSDERISIWAGDELGMTRDQSFSVFYCGDNDTAIRRLKYIVKHPNVPGYELDLI